MLMSLKIDNQIVKTYDRKKKLIEKTDKNW